jgi:hypothetical protein
MVNPCHPFCLLVYFLYRQVTQNSTFPVVGGQIRQTTSSFTSRFEAVEIDGNWHVLDHKHPKALVPRFYSEKDAKQVVEVWNTPAQPSVF